MDRQPERWHRFNDGDAPLAADDFAAFLADIGAGTWEPNLNVDESGDVGARRARRRRTLRDHRRAARSDAPRHEGDEDASAPQLHRASRRRGRGRRVERGSSFTAEAERRKKVGPLGAAVISKLRLETSKQPETRGWDENKAPPRAGPDALLATFLEVYCPFGHSMQYDDLLGMLVRGGRNPPRLRDFKETVTLPKRYPGNLDGIYLMEVQRPLSEVVVGFHELLAGPTEPDLTQAAPRRGAIVAPSSNKAWTLDVGARISIRACAPGSQAAMAAASRGARNDEGGAAASAGNASGRRTTSSKKKQKTTSAAAAAAAAVPPASEEQEAIHRDLAAQLDECITQKQNEEEEEEEEEEVAVAGARRGRKKQAVLMTQETGDTVTLHFPRQTGKRPSRKRKEGEVALPARRRRGGKEKATASVPEPAAERPRRGARGKPTEKAAAPAKTPKAKTPAKKSPAEAKTPAEKTPAEKTPAEKTPAHKSPAEKPSAKSKTPASKERHPTKSKIAARQSRGRERRPPRRCDAYTRPRAFHRPPTSRRAERIRLCGSDQVRRHGLSSGWFPVRGPRVGCSRDARGVWPRGSRSLKFLAAAAAGVPLLDMSFLDASRRAGKFLGPESFVEHLWKGGWRGADMGLVSPDGAGAGWRRARDRLFRASRWRWRRSPPPTGSSATCSSPCSSRRRARGDHIRQGRAHSGRFQAGCCGGGSWIDGGVGGETVGFRSRRRRRRRGGGRHLRLPPRVFQELVVPPGDRSVPARVAREARGKARQSARACCGAFPLRTLPRCAGGGERGGER